MTLTRFTPLLSVTVAHSYYVNHLCRRYQLSPTTDTAQWMKAWGLQWRINRSGFEIYGETSKWNSSSWERMVQESFLGFYFNSLEAAFSNFTEIPPLSSSQILTYQLQEEGTVARLLDISGFHYSRSLSPDFEGKSIQVTSDQGKLIATIPVPKNLVISFDFTIYSSNIYTFQANGLPSWSVFIASDVGFIKPKTLFAIGGNTLLNQLRNPKNHFSIYFHARKTLWNYFLFNFEKKGSDKVRIIDKSIITSVKKVLKFTKKNNTHSFSNGATAIFFQSEIDTPVMLMERPDYHFQLLQENSIIEERLPYPLTDLSIDQETKLFCSNVYYYNI